MITAQSKSPRLNRLFQRLDQAGRKAAFVAYVGAGDPDYPRCLEVVDALAANGVDILELGVPFSDPLADGEANQLSAQRALASGMTVDKCLSLVRDIRAKHPDLVLVFYSYLNPVAYARDFSRFCADSAAAGLDALLLLDLTPGEDLELKRAIDASPLALVALVAPTTPEERLERICQQASGFIYYVCREGVTGERDDFASGVDAKIAAIRRHTALPVVVGFGISKPAHVREAAKSADGVVVGSAIVRRVEAIANGKGGVAELGAFVKTLTSTLDA